MASFTVTLESKTLRAVVQKYQAEVERLEAKVKADIADAVANHTSLAEHYWQPRHEAWCRLRIAQKFLEVFDAET